MTPLPEPVLSQKYHHDPRYDIAYFTADQMRAYGAAEYKRAIEDAAVLCDAQAQGWKKNPFVAGCGGYIAAANCASYIRKLGETS